MITKAQIRNDLAILKGKFEGMSVVAIIDGETITTGVMSQMRKEENKLLAEGESNEIEKFIRFDYTDVTTVPTPNESTCTIDSEVFSITEVIVDSVKATIRCKLEEEWADI